MSLRTGAVARAVAAADGAVVDLVRAAAHEQRVSATTTAGSLALGVVTEPALLSCRSLATVDPESKAVLQAKEVIAVNQDPLGKGGHPLSR